MKYCPVCWLPVHADNYNGCIEGHFDSIRSSPCPAGGEPFRITLERRELVTT